MLKQEDPTGDCIYVETEEMPLLILGDLKLARKR